MSSRNALRRSRTYFLLLALALTGSLGCWEQWSNSWFPQMKWQPAVQAFERVEWQGRVEGFLPPEGSIPISGGEADNTQMTDAEADAMVEPYLYTYNGSIAPIGYNPPIGITDGYIMQPWTGFAINAVTDCWLIFPSRFVVDE